MARIVISIFHKRVSPVLDACIRLSIIDVDKKNVIERQEVSLANLIQNIGIVPWFLEKDKQVIRTAFGTSFNFTVLICNLPYIRQDGGSWVCGLNAEKAGVNQQRVSQIVGNANFGNIDTLLSQGRDTDYIEKH